MRNALLLIVALLICQGCHYLPFLTYRTAGDDLPKFSKKRYFGGEPQGLRTAYDISGYDWTIHPDPQKKEIKGLMKIYFRGAEARDTILLDLQGRLKVDAIKSDKEILKYKHKGDFLYIVFKEPLLIGEGHSLEIKYHGKPASIFSFGPINWSEDAEGKPWVSTITQGIGPHFIMPCKYLLYDEPDSTFIRVAAPRGLVAVANGKLLKTTPEGDGLIYHYAVMNPINIYNISFNIGDYVKLTYPYRDLTGTDREIEAYALKRDSAKAAGFYAQAPVVMGALEQLFGSFPWWEDGCRFLQTAITTGAMEHQFAISMGNILTNHWRPDTAIHLNSTLIHELSHEWWGNSVTASDHADLWLHEGLATYCEALVVERIYGKNAYALKINRSLRSIDNKRPVIKTFGVRYNSFASAKDGDIYAKGALFMHTLRMYINNDPLFFKTFKEAYQTFEKKVISTVDLQNFFMEKTALDLNPLFDVYLRQAEPPIISYYLDQKEQRVYFKWLNPLPEAFKLGVFIGNGEKEVKIYPTNTFQSVPATASLGLAVQNERSGYVVLKKDDSRTKD